MNKVSGKKSDFQLMSEDASRIIIGYGQKKVTGKNLYEWYEVYFYIKQKNAISLQEVKNAILDDVNARTDEKILTGFIYQDDNGDDVNVWLSKENQSNYSEAQRLADKAGAENYKPIKFKLGEDENRQAKYRTFQTLEDLNTFYYAVFAYIKGCVDAGWDEKDAIDWTPYEALFPQAEQANAGSAE